MSPFALTLILASAVGHSTWNYLAKRVEAGAVFVWLFDAVSAAIYAPVILVFLVVHGMTLDAPVVLLIVASSLLHMGYFVLLNWAYRAGDLSLVYPLARGTGPLLATAGAIVLLGERPHPIVVAGALLIAAGAVILGANPRDLWRHGIGPAVLLALGTGLFIAAYTLVDKEGVDVHHIPPLVYVWAGMLLSGLWLTPVAVRHADHARQLWQRHRRETLGIAILSPLAYFLVLDALVFTPVSYVAPAREIGILFGAIMGFQFLKEGDVLRRLGAAVLMVVGIVLLAV